MKEKVKDLWVEALRSGKYKQTVGFLKNDNGYCCLGVLCDVYAKTQKKQGFKKTNSGEFKFLDKSPGYTGYKDTSLPKQVMLWSKISEQEGGHFNKKKNDYTLLSFLNDEKKLSFEQIANEIEENWKVI